MKLLTAGEYHSFEAAGKSFVYLVPSAAVFKLDGPSGAVLGLLTGSRRRPRDVVSNLAPRFSADEVRGAMTELHEAHAIKEVLATREPPPRPVKPRGIPLATVVLNVTSKCNLACKYCYEYGEDRITDEVVNPVPRFMSDETARQSVDFAFREAGASDSVHITFFGGETLLNFKVLQSTVDYALRKGDEEGKSVDFNLTTNATLLRPQIIEWLIEHNVAVTVSIDGPRDQQDEFRVFKNGMGSYDMILPKIRELLQRHRARPIGARVTLTKHNLDVVSIFRHLHEEVGFQEIGFAPVTSAPGRDWAIENEGYDDMLSHFEELSWEFLERAVENRHHPFSNVKEELSEIHKGMSKAYPCGAGLGLMGVATDGDVALCHRFAGSKDHEIGSVATGIDRDKQSDFLDRHHVHRKAECMTCWARPLCAGGCYHEAHTRYGDTAEPNLHYCDWIRRWTDICLRVYGELSERNPTCLARLAN